MSFHWLGTICSLFYKSPTQTIMLAPLTMVAVKGMLSIREEARAETHITKIMAMAKRWSSGTAWEGRRWEQQMLVLLSLPLKWHPSAHHWLRSNTPAMFFDTEPLVWGCREGRCTCFLMCDMDTGGDGGASEFYLSIAAHVTRVMS